MALSFRLSFLLSFFHSFIFSFALDWARTNKVWREKRRKKKHTQNMKRLYEASAPYTTQYTKKINQTVCYTIALVLRLTTTTGWAKTYTKQKSWTSCERTNKHRRTATQRRIRRNVQFQHGGSRNSELRVGTRCGTPHEVASRAHETLESNCDTLRKKQRFWWAKRRARERDKLSAERESTESKRIVYHVEATDSLDYYLYYLRRIIIHIFW